MNTTRQEALAGRRALGALLGDYGVEEPMICRISWLGVLLDELEAQPEIMTLLENDDPHSARYMIHVVRELAEEGLAATAMLRTKPLLKNPKRLVDLDAEATS